MPADSIEAYDIPERVRRYDADMDIMHPLRCKMIDVALEVLPFRSRDALTVLDLGAGTGVFTKRVLERFPHAGVIAVDGAAKMLELAKSRLGPLSDRVTWVHADFLDFPEEAVRPESLDVAVSSYALHHLDASQKRDVLTMIVGALKPGGWMLNADIVIAADSSIESRIQALRVDGVTGRAAQSDERFATPQATRSTLNALEAAENDQPQTLADDLDAFREAGIPTVEVFWKEYREAVIGGMKPVTG